MENIDTGSQEYQFSIVLFYDSVGSLNDMLASLHPSLATIPVQWDYEMPYGILYAKKPSTIIRGFVDIIAKDFTLCCK